MEKISATPEQIEAIKREMMKMAYIGLAIGLVGGVAIGMTF